MSFRDNDIWNQIDHRLVNLKIQQVLEAEHEEFVGEKHKLWVKRSKNHNAAVLEIMKMMLAQTDKIIETRYDIYCDVWKAQRHAKTPEFIRAFKNNVIAMAIHARTNACIHDFDLTWKRCNYSRAELDPKLATFRRSMQQLQATWQRKLEIEAIELEHAAKSAKASSSTAKQPRRSSDPAQRERLRRISIAVARGRRGREYCEDLEKLGVSTPVQLILRRVPAQIVAAWDAADDPRFRKLNIKKVIQDEKSRAAKKWEDLRPEQQARFRAEAERL